MKEQIKYLGLIDGQFRYKVEVNGHLFDYFTGIGHVEILTQSERSKSENKEFLKVLSSEEEETELKASFNKSQRQQLWDTTNRIYRRHPKIEHVLECLQSDAQCGDMSFDQFCDDFGYSNDSLKALDVYRACADTAKKLRGFKFPEVE